MSEEQRTIYNVIPAIMAEMGSLGKDKRGHGFNFRGIDDVYNHLQKLLAKHEIFTVPQVLEERTEDRKSSKGNTLIYRVFKIKYTFHHSSGTSFDAIVIGEAMDSGDKASNKAMSIAHKYAFFQVFAIPTEELVDPDAEVHRLAPSFSGTDDEIAKLHIRLAKDGVPESKWDGIAIALNGTPLVDVSEKVTALVKSWGNS